MGQELIMKLKEVKQALVDLNVHGMGRAPGNSEKA